MGKTEDWLDLLQTPEPDMFGARARSASDAAVLRRKGHLKEQDSFIQFVQGMHQTHTTLEVMQKMDRWIAEHRAEPRTSRLRRMVPTIGSFFVPLKMVEAFQEYDDFFALSRRQYVPPNFAELRHIFNIAQVHASAQSLKLITFDADGTLYADGAHIEHDNEMIRHIVSLMRSNVHVAIVTAAGYPGAPERFEQRVEGLLAAFRQLQLPKHITDRFHIMGGECNYLLRVNAEKRLEFVPDEEWKSLVMKAWTEAQCQRLLDSAERLLLEGAHRLRLPVQVIRKERAVGVVPTSTTIYEVLEELAITVQNQLQADLPFCAFNGGNDVFVDVGNKSLGLEALMGYLGFSPPEVLHVGDRFSDTGNDSATRDCCSILWVANPEETDFFIKLLLGDIRQKKTYGPTYIE
ncbi:IMP-specific 5-nucleotidase [Micractinium conductrix]|uniref:IMP-specific 5'-nucleotidase 1 n=1 Tax=Micractinium conductrix TaxID=554055 RepID=A0A2P6VDL8_9CHLO|nr:IMP-specific 5-nucleotidase [Micractinium conductrix]|eukprot:PSC72200.1 IMP-specific 5-nucleotidase [Micractinium conductrix]